MSTLELTFIACVLLVAFAYVGYPITVALLAKFRPAPLIGNSTPANSVTVVLATFNELANLQRRVKELLGLLQTCGVRGELVVVSDGCTDGTRKFLAAQRHPALVVVELPARRGKAAAVTEGCKVASGEVILLADARQSWDSQAVSNLLAVFADSRVGAASGELHLEPSVGVIGGVGIYWRFEKWIRQNESRSGSCVGVSGSISAVRKSLFKPIPEGTILDDVFLPMSVVWKGSRVVYVKNAKAYDRLPDLPSREFRRKVRTQTGNFQLLSMWPALLSPFSNPIWFRYICHKVLRLVAPWALLLAFIVSFLIQSPPFDALAWLQSGIYLTAALALGFPNAIQSPKLQSLGSFLLLNAATWVAFWVWVSGRAKTSWEKTSYSPDAERSATW